MTITLNGSGSITGLTSGAGIAATALSGQVPDANAPSGSVIQVLTDTQSGEQSTTSTSFVNTVLSVSITPTSASSKIFVLYTGSAGNDNASQTFLTITRNGTNLGNGNAGLMRIWFQASGSYHFGGFSMSLLDSPATTSATTYTVQFRTDSGIGYISGANSTDSLTVFEIAG